MGGYKSLLIYRLAVTIDDFNDIFIGKFLHEISFRRTKEQMEQASRSGKQNIVESSLEKSAALGLNLISVSRSSYGELKEDYEDFLRKNKLILWDKNDPRIIKIRLFRESIEKPTDLSNLSNWSNLDFEKAENFANMMVCLLSKQTYLLDKYYQGQENLFIKEGGFKENLFKKRMEYRKKFGKLD